jgi:endonuclease/exonuclease/phosphatase family metal-dependent hydrolase
MNYRIKILLTLFICIIDVRLFAQQDVDEFPTLKAMTYNIHHGEGIDGKIDIDRIAELILQNNIDVAALQEVDKGVERTNKIDIMHLLSEKTGMNFYFDKNIDYQDGEYGNGILSRYPIIQSRNFHYTMIREGEQRGLLQCVINFHEIEIAILNTHIDYREDDTERLKNVEEIKQVIANYSELPIILCGDFNDLPGSRTHNSLKETFIDVWEECGDSEGFTYHAEKPSKRIDYIFLLNINDNETKNIELKPINVEIINSISSDHLPLITEFELISK